MAIEGNRIIAIGRDEDILRLKTPDTELLDLDGKMVMPGLIDSHVHACGAAMTEFDHPIPDMESVQDVLDYFKARAEVLEDGEWIVLQQVFITRLREQRYPTRAELDQVAPNNPCVFRTGPDASLNTLALKLSGIDKDFRVTDGGPGYIEKDPQTGEPTGILRSCTRYIKSREAGRKATEQDRYERLLTLFRDYSSVGITGICDGDATSRATSICSDRCWKSGNCPSAIAAQYHVDTIGPIEQIRAEHPQSGAASASAGRADAPHHRRQGLPRRRHAHRQRLHEPAVGRQQDLRDRRPQLPRRPVHPEGSAPAHGPHRDRVRPSVHGPHGRRRRGRDAGRRLRRAEQDDADPRHAALHHALELHEPRDRAGKWSIWR